MALELKPPRSDKKTSCYYVRGTHLGVSVNRSTKTGNRETARKVLEKIKRDIERGTFSDKPSKTFASAVAKYLKAGGDDRFITPLLEHFKTKPLSEIDQDAIDDAADAIFPDGNPATRNRQVYTPVSAILKYSGVNTLIKRPKGSNGNKRLDWLKNEAEAGRLFDEAAKVDMELSTLLIFLVYTGARIGEALSLRVRDLELDESQVYLPHSKNEQPRAIHLTPYVVTVLRAHPRGLDRDGRIFRFTKGQRLYQMLAKATKAAGVPWFTFHHACHTYATWMRRHAGLDERGLVGTGRWKDQKSVSRYTHVVTTEEAQKADLLPVPKARRVG